MMAIRPSRWQCSHCLVEFRTQQAAARHEATCYKHRPSTAVWGKKEEADDAEEDGGGLAAELGKAVDAGQLGERDALHILGYEGDG